MTSSTSMEQTGATRCPCGSGTTYDQCCRRYHQGEPAPTAEALMRSRYTAFAMGDMVHLDRTWHPDTRPRQIHDDIHRRWTRLDVIRTTGGGLLDHEGTVEFDAHFVDRDGEGALHEDSTFARVDGSWVYVACRE
jgi:SEC-C motif-containing protein